MDGQGYGQVRREGKLYLVHRLACAAHHGPAPVGYPDSLHSCDNPLCFSGDHLSWGNRSRNEREKRDRLGTHSKQVLSREQAYYIKYVAPRHRGQGAALARQFGVSRVTISHIWLGRQWADI